MKPLIKVNNIYPFTNIQYSERNSQVHETIPAVKYTPYKYYAKNKYLRISFASIFVILRHQAE